MKKLVYLIMLAMGLQSVIVGMEEKFGKLEIEEKAPVKPGHVWVEVAGDPVQISKDILKRSKTLKLLIDQGETEISITVINKEIWKDFVLPALISGHSSVVRGTSSLKKLIEIIEAAHLLEIPYLLDAALEEATDYIRKNIDKIGEDPGIFSIFAKNLPFEVLEKLSDKLMSYTIMTKIKTVGDKSYGTGETMALSHDGKKIAVVLQTISNTRTIIVYDTSTEKLIKIISNHTNWINAITFSPDDTELLSAPVDEPMKLWNVITGKEIKTFAQGNNNVESVAFSPDGKTIVTGNGDGTIIIWDVTTGKEIKTFSGHTKRVLSVSMSPDGRLLASSSYDKTIKIWDMATGKEIKTLTDTGLINVVTFSPNGKLLASGSMDKTIKLWDMSRGLENTILIKTFAGHTDEVFALAFNPNGTKLASGSRDKTIKLWDVATGAEIMSLKGDEGFVVAVTFVPEDQILVSGHWDNHIGGKVTFWNVPKFDFDQAMFAYYVIKNLKRGRSYGISKYLGSIYQTLNDEQKEILGLN